MSIKYKIPREFTDYGKTRETIIATTFDKILSDSKRNFELLMMLCLLDSQSIDKESFRLIASDGEVDEFISYLRKYSILEETDKLFSIHRLNQEMGAIYLLERFSSEKIKACLTLIVDKLAAYSQIEWKWFKSDKKMTQSEIKRLIPHLEAVISKFDLYKNLENIDSYKIKILTALYFAYNGESSYKEIYERGQGVLKLNSEKNVITGRDLAVLLLQQIYVSVYSGETSEIEKNATECLKICKMTENTDHLRMGAMLYLCRYYFDFVPDYKKAISLLKEIFEFRKTVSEADWDITMCVFANQLYRSYESCYINDKPKMMEAIEYLQRALSHKGFAENYRENKIQDIPVNKTVFIMYAIEMMVNIARAYNMMGDFSAAFEKEQDIFYIYELLRKQGIRFFSQEFQVNRVFGETLFRQGKIKEAHKILSEALESGYVSSEIDLFCVYTLRAETNVELCLYDEAIQDCESALMLKQQNSNYFLLNRCRCLFSKVIAHYKKRQLEEMKGALAEFQETVKKLQNGLEKATGKKVEFKIDDLPNKDVFKEIVQMFRMKA